MENQQDSTNRCQQTVGMRNTAGQHSKALDTLVQVTSLVPHLDKLHTMEGSTTNH